uniref:RNase H type-1 domain-containing protein n=1 Tax=Quercus lobata TaxID=97700 RepID=A0A7N2KPV5_QUELO
MADHDRRREAIKRQRSQARKELHANQDLGTRGNHERVFGEINEGQHGRPYVQSGLMNHEKGPSELEKDVQVQTLWRHGISESPCLQLSPISQARVTDPLKSQLLSGTDLVKSLFLPFEAATILRILISFSLLEDSLIWLGNKNGSFIVKSADYIAAKLVEQGELEEGTSNSSALPLWRKIWQLKVPHKWMEITTHALIHCAHAKDTWALWLDYPIDLVAAELDILDIAGQIFEKGTSRDLDTFFMTAWSIWGNRNQAIHNDVGITSMQVWDYARRALLDFNNAFSQSTLTPPTPHHKWTAPPSSFFKINVDGATSANGGNSCIGVTIRDSTSTPIEALSKPLSSDFSTEVTEAYVLLQGVLFASEMQEFVGSWVVVCVCFQLVVAGEPKCLCCRREKPDGKKQGALPETTKGGSRQPTVHVCRMDILWEKSQTNREEPTYVVEPLLSSKLKLMSESILIDSDCRKAWKSVCSVTILDFELAIVLEDNFGLGNCCAVIGTFIHEVNLIANVSFSKVEVAADSNIELQ